MVRILFIILISTVACRDIYKGDALETKIKVEWDTLNYFLDYCSASSENGNLKLHIAQTSENLSNFEVQIVQRGKEFQVELNPTWSVTDSSFVNARFRILQQHIQLNKSAIDWVDGELKLLLLGHRSYFRNRGEMKLREDWDTLHVFGKFSAPLLHPTP